MSNQNEAAEQGVGHVDSTNYRHYWLYAGLIMFQPKGVEDAAAHIPQSAVVVSEQHLFGISELARGQRAIQKQLFSKLDADSGDVRDIVSTGVSYLGYGTEEQFNPVQAPTQEEKQAEVAAVVETLQRSALPDDGTKPNRVTRINPAFEG